MGTTEWTVMGMELTTQRCLIRNMVGTDAADLYRVLSDAHVMLYLEPPFDMARTKEFIRSAGLCEPPLVYVIVWKETGNVIGHAIFHAYEQNDYEIGWVLGRDYWGRGIADEVTKALIRYAGDLGVTGCVIACDARQIASKKIAIKNGFVYQGQSDGLERYRCVL